MLEIIRHKISKENIAIVGFARVSLPKDWRRNLKIVPKRKQE
jgi:hypothetical protein